jgi:hypothetical protein
MQAARLGARSRMLGPRRLRLVDVQLPVGEVGSVLGQTGPFRHVLAKQDDARAGVHPSFAITYPESELWCTLEATLDPDSIQTACQLDALPAVA